VEQQLVEIRQQGLSRSMGNPTPGVNAFSAPVFDYSGNIVLAITLMGSSGILDSSWTGAQAQAIKACAAAVSRRLGYSA
jgi:DNA-binding IclR family transcriptional regulator